MRSFISKLICILCGHDMVDTGRFVDGEDWPGADHCEPAVFEVEECSRCGRQENEFRAWGSVSDLRKAYPNYWLPDDKTAA